MNLDGNLWLIVIAVVVIALLAFLLLRPRQRVQLTDTAPLRPHMIDPKPEAEGRGLAGEAAAATSDVAGEILRAPVHQVLAGNEPRDEFVRMKGDATSSAFATSGAWAVGVGSIVGSAVAVGSTAG